MKRPSSLLLVVVAVIAALLPARAGAAPDAATEQRVLAAQAADEAAGAGSRFVGGQVLVTFKDGTTTDEASAALQSTDAVTTKQVSQDELEGAIPTATVSVAETASVADAVSALESDPTVESAQPNYIYYPMDDVPSASPTLAETVSTVSGTSLAAQSTTIDDPSASDQWQLSSVGCYTAWDTVRCAEASAAAGSTVTVAIIDSGILYDHEDLNANIVATYNSYLKSTATADVNDVFGHGTHVAGIVSAVSNNAVGVSGISYNAGLLPINANSSTTVGSQSFSTSSIRQGYNYLLSQASADVNGDGAVGTVAEEYDVRVVNMSLGMYWAPGTTIDSLMTTAIDSAYAAGIVTVCAAGNSPMAYKSGGVTKYAYRPFPCFPGDYATCVSVMNLTSGNVLSSTSNYNESGSTAKDICAPGASILSTYRTSTSSYKYDSGTSMASPVVAGVLALEFADNPGLTADEAVQELYATADDLGDVGWDETYGYGKADAATAVDRIIGAGDVTAADVTYTGSAVTGNVTVTDGSGTKLVEGTDYTVSYENNVEMGTGTVTVTGTGTYGSRTGYVGTVTKTFAIKDKVTRLAGATALDTMAAIIEASFTATSDTVVIARDDDFHDALTAAGLAGLAQAPVLLVKTDELPEQTRAELVRLKPSKVVVCGGTAAVSNDVAQAVAGVSGATLYRCAGAAAPDTAVAIFDRAHEITAKTWSTTAFLATDTTFQDALSASPYAWWAGCPIFLTSSADSISDSTVSAIVSGGFSEVKVIGGTAAIPASVVERLSAAGVSVSEADRLAGATALETSEQVVEWECRKGMHADGLAIATSEGFWDALTGAAMCGKTGAPLLLVDPTNANRATLDGFVTTNRASVAHAYVFGGTSAVPATVKDYLEGILATG